MAYLRSQLQKLGTSKKVAITAAIVILQLLVIFDLFYDYSHGASVPHLVFDQVLVLVLAIVIGIMIPGINRELFKFASKADEYKLYKEKIRSSVYSYIESMFEKWALSKTEREIALLILKGLSFKDIAELRTCSEVTIRQQAGNIYKKSGLKNKSEFFSFFIDDFLPDSITE